MKAESRKNKRQWVELIKKKKINLNCSDTSKGKLIRSMYIPCTCTEDSGLGLMIIKITKGRAGAKVRESCSNDELLTKKTLVISCD